MSSSPACVVCGEYIHYGWSICPDDTKDILEWITKVIESGMTDDLLQQGIQYKNMFYVLKEWEEKGQIQYGNK